MRRSSGMLAVALAFVLLVPAVALADHGRDVARGNFSQFFQRVSFTASSNANGTQAGGNFKYVNPNTDPDTIIEGDVTCLLVTANAATLSGDVTRVRPPGVFSGVQSFILSATDTGKFASAPDTSAVGFSSGPPVCTPLVFQSPITDGEIIVHDSL